MDDNAILIGTPNAKRWFADLYPNLKVLDGPVLFTADHKGMLLTPEHGRIVVECDPDTDNPDSDNHAIFVDVVEITDDYRTIRTFTMNVDESEGKHYLLPEYRTRFKDSPFIILGVRAVEAIIPELFED